MRFVRTDSDIEGLHDPALQSLIRSRIEEIAEYVDHFSELVHFIVLTQEDGREVLEQELGFALEPVPPDYFGDEGGYVELLFVLCDDGSGVSVLIPEVMKQEPWLAELLPAFRTRGAMK